MSESASQRSPRERQVDALIAEYYQSVERGVPVDQTEFLAAHPDFADELREFFADIGQLGDLVRPAAPDLGETRILPPSEAPDFAPGTVIRYFGEYELLEQVGMGGMGVVYKARQSKLKRIVALKLIKSGTLANPHDLQRFQVEARAAARLSHPGIVPVHEVGVFQDQHFYTMEYVPGGSLSRLYRDGPVVSRRAAELVQKLAEAMHYAHQNGIVHRDLKPANVLLTADGQPRITDFGLAKLIQSEDETHEATLTETGQILGTAGYMSPEQAAGKTRLVGPPTDIYALGAVLYALLTSRAPFVGETVPHTLMQVLHKEPVSPRLLNPSLPRDLETICLKCLEKEPHKRYGTAQLLADDLGRFLAGRPVIARPISRTARAWRWCWRNPVVSGLLATVAASLLIGTAVSTYYWDQAENSAGNAIESARLEREARNLADQRTKEAVANSLLAETRRKEAVESAALAESRKRQSDENARVARLNLYVAHMQRIQKAWDEGQVKEIIGLLDRYLSQPGEEDLRSFEWHYWHRRCHGEQLSLVGNRGEFGAKGTEILTLSKDIRVYNAISSDQIRSSEPPAVGNYPPGVPLDSPWTVAITDLNSPLTNKSCSIVLYNAATGEEQKRFEGHTGKINSWAFSSDRKVMASHSEDRTLRIWDIETGKQLSIFEGSSEEGGPYMAFSPDGQSVAFPQRDSLTLWNWNTLLAPEALVGFFGAINQIVFNPTGTRVAAGTLEGQVAIWDVESAKVLKAWKGHSGSVGAMAFSPDGRQIATGSNDMTVALWDAITARRVATFMGHQGSVQHVEFSPEGTRLLSSGLGEENGVRVWDVAHHDETPSFMGSSVSIENLAVSPDGDKVIVCDKYGTSSVWNIASKYGSPLGKMDRTGISMTRAAFDPTGTALAGHFSGGLRGGYGIWEAATGKPRLAFPAFKNVALCSLFSPDGLQVFVGQMNSGANLWDAKSGELIRHYPLGGMVTDAVFTRDGQQVMTVEASVKGIKVWDVSTGDILRTLHAEDESKVHINRLRLSPSGNQLAAARTDGKVILWDIQTGQQIASLDVYPDGNALDIAFSLDGARIATTGGQALQSHVQVWDVTSGEKILTLAADGRARCLAITPDGTTLISGYEDGRIRFWDTSRTVQRGLTPTKRVPSLKSRQLTRTSTALNTVAHSRDGKLALTGGDDHLVRLWELKSSTEIKVFAGHTGSIRTVAFSPDSQIIISGSEDGTLRFWDRATGEQRGLIEADGTFNQIRASTGIGGENRLSNEGARVFATNSDGKMRILELATAELMSETDIGLPLTEFALLSVTPDQESLFIGTDQGLMHLSRRKTGNTFTMRRGAGAVSCVDPQVPVMLLAGGDHSIRLWDIGTDTLSRVFSGHRAAVNEVRLLRDRMRFVSCSSDGTVRLWNVETGEELARGTKDGEFIGLSVAPDGKTCLTVHHDGRLVLWELPPAQFNLEQLQRFNPLPGMLPQLPQQSK